MLTETQVIALEKAKTEKQAHGEKGYRQATTSLERSREHNDEI